LADGIDTDAHQGCLDVGGRTIAVLGNGVDVIYPYANRRLYQQVLEHGLLLSEYPAGTQPDRAFFPRRNRIVAGLCRAVLVLEAGEKSGALITAHLANDYGRDVYALAGSLDNAKAKGCLQLIQHGAQIIVGEAELLEMLGTIPQPTQLNLLDSISTPPTLPPSLEPSLAQVWTSIVDLGDSAPLDLIVQTTGMATGDVSSALLQLELEGFVVQLPGMRYQIRT
jgi:DNA processing protein